jgi:hypothetical protein
MVKRTGTPRLRFVFLVWVGLLSIPDLDPQTLSSVFRDLCRQLELTLQHGAKDRDTSLGLAVIRCLTSPMVIRVA